jgi:4-hydroxy-3-methylbut-2-enyl diphosphate reductase
MAYKPGDIVDKVLESEHALRLLRDREEKASQPPEPPSSPEQEAMPSLEEAMPITTVGDIVEGTVVQVTEEGVVVDVGSKSEGLLPLDEFHQPFPWASEPQVAIGDKVEVYVLSIDDETGSVRLSKKRADYEKAWKRVIDAREEGESLSAVVTERVKGGIRVDLGVPAFVPASHCGFRNLNLLDRIVGSTVRVKVIEADKKNNKVIASRRLALEEERKDKKSKIFDIIQEGQIVKGTVRSIVDYGAFVDVGGADGLLHISEMAWTRINHPSELLKVGDQIEVMVLKADPEKERISLGLRQISPDPWQELVKQVRQGSVVTVKVSRLAARAAFVRLPNRIEGIIPISELSLERVSAPGEVVQVGDEFEAQVVSISAQERKIILSKRRLSEKQRKEETRAFASTSGPNAVTLGDMYGDLLRSTAPKSQPSEPASQTAPAESQPEETELEIQDSTPTISAEEATSLPLEVAADQEDIEAALAIETPVAQSIPVEEEEEDSAEKEVGTVGGNAEPEGATEEKA